MLRSTREKRAGRRCDFAAPRVDPSVSSLSSATSWQPGTGYDISVERLEFLEPGLGRGDPPS